MAIWGPTPIAADADDAEVNGGTFSDKTDEGYAGGTFFEVKDDGASSSWGILRFLNVTVPQGATINSATLRIWITGVGSIDAANSILTIFADVGANRQDALSTTHRPPSTNWTNSTASVQASSLAIASPRAITITTVIQELVDLGGWASGDEICLNLDPQANGSDAYWSFSATDYSLNPDTQATRATLEIDYTAAGGSSSGISFSDSVIRKIQSRRPRPFAPGNAR